MLLSAAIYADTCYMALRQRVFIADASLLLIVAGDTRSAILFTLLYDAPC